MAGNDATDAEVDLIEGILSGDGVTRIRGYVRQRAAEVRGRALTESLWREELARAYTEHERDVFSDPDLEALAWAEVDRLVQTQPALQIEGVFDRAVRTVIDRHGTADSRAVSQMRSARRHELTLSEDEVGRYNPRRAEQEADDQIAMDRMDAIAKIKISRQLGRQADTDKDFGRKNRDRQRAERVAERERVVRELSEL